MAVQIGAHFPDQTRRWIRSPPRWGCQVFQKEKLPSSEAGALEPTQLNIALGLGAQVTILDISAKRLAVLEDVFGHQIQNPYVQSILTLKPASVMPMLSSELS